jgi:hypothetical protein
MAAAGIALFRLWMPDEDWPARSRGEVIGRFEVRLDLRPELGV